MEIVYYTLRTVRCKLRILRTKFENSEFISLVFFIRIKSLHLVIMFISHNYFFYLNCEKQSLNQCCQLLFN